MAIVGPTKDHGEILAWAHRHQATPAEVVPFVFNGEPAVLRFVFGSSRTETPEVRPITWDSFFAHFDGMGLSMVYEDGPGRGANIDYQFLQTEAEDPFRSTPNLH